MKKILTVLGARPQFIKAAPVSKALKEAGFQEVMIHTGQHFDANMSQVFFDEMGIERPQYNLDIHGLSHAAMTARMLEEVEKILIEENPDCVLVYGDTNSTMAGALAAAKLLIPIAHVEAGLRSFNQEMPEEINRIVTDRVSKFLFCPTETAIVNLEKEGFKERTDLVIENTGDVMYDAILQFGEIAENTSDILTQNNLEKDGYILCTIHRQENTNNPVRMENILNALKNIAKEKTVLFPVHPRSRSLVKSLESEENIILTAPVGYLDMVNLLKNCAMVITDSGGLQKEAYFNEKFCVTCRDETEWVELVEAGVNQLCEASQHKIEEAHEQFSTMKFPVIPKFYGKGDASRQIALILQSNLK